MAIEAILFDLGKVLVDFDLLPMLEKLTACCSKPADLEHLMRDAELLHRFESGQMSNAQYYEHVCSATGLNMEPAAFWSAVESIFAPGLIVSESLLESLSARYPLILVSNTNEVHARYIQANYRIFDYFRHKVLSFEVRSVKPDRRIYEKAIELSGRRPGELFFTDDRPENVEAARQLGIHAHRFISEADLVVALREAGVEVGDVVHRDPFGLQP